MPTHFNAMGNKYWGFLQKSNSLYLSARQQHLLLLNTLRDDNISFKGIERFLMAEARRAGLLRKDRYCPKVGGMREPSKTELKDISWYRELSKFTQWVKANYKDYGVDKTRVARKNERKIVVEIRKPSQKAIEAKAAEVKAAVTSGAADAVGSQSGVVPSDGDQSGAEELLANSDDKVVPLTSRKDTPDEKNSITSPVTKDLSPIEKQQLILQNLDVLGEICKQKGAIEEYNLLMDALGMEELVINDEPEIAVG